MPMPPYPILCYSSGCSERAVYKVAARWSDGMTSELKTYSLACQRCMPELFRIAQAKRDRCRLAAGETLESPTVFHLAHGERDCKLSRCDDLPATTPSV